MASGSMPFAYNKMQIVVPKLQQELIMDEIPDVSSYLYLFTTELRHTCIVALYFSK